MDENNKWYSSFDCGLEEARKADKPIFMFFCSETCFYCNQMDIFIYKQKEVSTFIQSEFVTLRLTPDTPDPFRTYNVKNVPTFIVAGTDGLEYNRRSGFLEAEELMAFCLLALGKIYYNRNQLESAHRHMEKLAVNYPRSIHAPEGIFLRGLYRYMTTKDPVHFRESFLMLANSYPESIWVKRSLILYCHPSAVIDWDADCKERRDYWESPDAFVKCYATIFNGPSAHQIKGT